MPSAAINTLTSVTVLLYATAREVTVKELPRMSEVVDMAELKSVGPAACRPTVRGEVFTVVPDCPLVSVAVTETS